MDGKVFSLERVLSTIMKYLMLIVVALMAIEIAADFTDFMGSATLQRLYRLSAILLLSAPAIIAVVSAIHFIKRKIVAPAIVSAVLFITIFGIQISSLFI